MQHSIKLSIGILTVSILTACGGSDSSDSDKGSHTGGSSSNASAFSSYMTDLKQDGLYYTASDTNNGYYRQKLIDTDDYQTLQTKRYDFNEDDTGKVDWDVTNDAIIEKLDQTQNDFFYQPQSYQQLLADGSWLDYASMQWRYVNDSNALLKKDPAGNTTQKTTVSYVNNLAKSHSYPSGSRAYSYQTVATTDTYLVKKEDIESAQNSDNKETATTITQFIQSHNSGNPLSWQGKINGNLKDIDLSFVDTVDTATEGDVIFLYCSTNNSCVEELGTWQINDVSTTQALTITPPEQIESEQNLTYVAYQNDLPVLPAIFIKANTIIASADESEVWDMPHNKTGYNYWQSKYFDFFPNVLD